MSRYRTLIFQALCLVVLACHSVISQDAQPQPVPVQPQPVPVQQAQPVPVQPQPVAEDKPVPVEQNPVPVEPAQAQPIHVEPVHAEPVQAQPVHVEPVQAQPVHVEPVQAQPVHVEPVQAQPVHVEPVQAQPVHVEPVQAQPVHVEPPHAEPVHVDVPPPQPVDPVQGQPINVEPVQAHQAMPAHPQPVHGDHPGPGPGEQAGYHDDGPRHQGAPNEMDASEEDYRRAHDHIHMFDESGAHHKHDEYGNRIYDDHQRKYYDGSVTHPPPPGGAHHDQFYHDHHGEDEDDDDDDDDDSMVEEWSEHMDDFIPDMLVTFKLPARSDEYFYQEVGPVPTLIRGGYFVAGDAEQSQPVHFSVMDPKGEVALKRNKAEGLFHFVTKMEGTYAFAITNNNWMGDKFVTFVIGAGNETTLSVADVNNVNENVVMVARMIRDIHTESLYLWGRQKGQMLSVESAHSRVFWMSLLEFTAILTMAVIQVFYIKNLVSDKRLF